MYEREENEVSAGRGARWGRGARKGEPPDRIPYAVIN